jgi:hypothetical protein
MTTGTYTTTFTSVDIRKVLDNFAADYSMVAQSTGLQTRYQVDMDVTDLKLFAESKYLVSVVLILWDAQDNKVRARRYTVSESAVGWTADQPGNNMWPQTPGGHLQLIATLSDQWWQLSDSSKVVTRSRLGIKGGWDRTDTDTSFTTMTATQDRRYASNGYGLQRTTYR